MLDGFWKKRPLGDVHLAAKHTTACLLLLFVNYVIHNHTSQIPLTTKDVRYMSKERHDSVPLQPPWLRAFPRRGRVVFFSLEVNKRSQVQRRKKAATWRAKNVWRPVPHLNSSVFIPRLEGVSQGFGSTIWFVLPFWSPTSKYSRIHLVNTCTGNTGQECIWNMQIRDETLLETNIDQRSPSNTSDVWHWPFDHRLLVMNMFIATKLSKYKLERGKVFFLLHPTHRGYI